MASRPASPRLDPVHPTAVSAEADELLRAAGGADGPTLNIFATLVRYPGLFRRWVPFAGKVLAGELPARDRELAVLRTGWRCQSVYEWGQHVLIGRAAGLTDDEIRRVQAGPAEPGWDPFEATILRAVDELHDDSCVSDATWATLADRYDDRQLIQLLLLVGQYHLVSFALNSLGVQREPGVPGFEV
jgi:alkylhydroperoxidase family enzyme